jgi:NlpC/P60 family
VAVQPASGGQSTVTGAQIVSEAKKFVGDPYVYGAAGPSSFDCSGLVQYVLGTLGISAPRTSEDQWAWVQRIKASQVGPGDLVFMQFPGDNASPGHVEFYIGNGQVLGADDPAQGVAVTSLSSVAGNVVGYGRIPSSTVTATGTGTGSDTGTVPGWLSDTLQAVGAALGLSSGDLSGIDPLTAIGSGISDVATEFEGAAKILGWLTLPSNWTRIFAGLFGGVFLGAGVWFLTREAGSV